MRIINQTTENAPIDTVRPHPKNPRQGDIGAIHTSITANGFYGTVIAQRSTGYILAGNHRWQAAQHAGATTIPITWIDVDDEHALRILLADNRTNDLANYDNTALAELLQQLHATTGNILGTGYDDDDLNDILTNLTPPNWDDAMTALPNGDKEPFQQMTFTLHDEQAAIIQQAIQHAKTHDHPEHHTNQNANGNALAAIAEAYLRDR